MVKDNHIISENVYTHFLILLGKACIIPSVLRCLPLFTAITAEKYTSATNVYLDISSVQAKEKLKINRKITCKKINITIIENRRNERYSSKLLSIFFNQFILSPPIINKEIIQFILNYI